MAVELLYGTIANYSGSFFYFSLSILHRSCKNIRKGIQRFPVSFCHTLSCEGENSVAKASARDFLNFTTCKFAIHSYRPELYVDQFLIRYALYSIQYTVSNHVFALCAAFQFESGDSALIELKCVGYCAPETLKFENTATLLPKH